MDKAVLQAVESLTNTYAKYFVEDFSGMVMNNVDENSTLSQEMRNGVVNDMLTAYTKPGTTPSIANINSATKFVSECAVFALMENVAQPESRDTYDSIKNRPSVYHDELNQLVEASAAVYTNVLDKTVVGVVAKDATQTAELIITGAANRTASVETGGRVHAFNWGILSDGLWLNSALIKAYDLAKIFRPGDQVNAYYATVGFDFARNHVSATAAPDADGAFQLITTDAGNVQSMMDITALKDMLFRPGSLAMVIDKWELGMKDPEHLVASVSELSNLAQTLPKLINSAKALYNDDLVSEGVVVRMEAALNVVTLCLASFEALRETTYSDALVLYVKGEGVDPTVDVYINQDATNAYYAAGGEEADLSSMGTYLDPRKGMPKANGGYKSSWALNRRIDILGDVIATESYRLEAKRNTDADAVMAIAQEGIGGIVQSYAAATNQSTVPTSIQAKINRVGRKLVEHTSDQNFSLETEITKILVDTIGDPLITSVADKFVQFATDSDDNVRSSARDLTIVASAAEEMIKSLFVPQDEHTTPLALV